MQFLQLPRIWAGFYAVFIIILSAFFCTKAKAQTPASMYEQASEVSGMISRYDQDINAIKNFYWPYASDPATNDELEEKDQVFFSPEQRKRLIEVNESYLKQLAGVNFESISIYGRVDYILLKQEILLDISELQKEDKKYNAIKPYITFADSIYFLEKERRRGQPINGHIVATTMDHIMYRLKADSAALSHAPKMDKALAVVLHNAVKGVRGRLRDFYNFYNRYDPMFSWWVPAPYKTLDSAIADYSHKIVHKEGLQLVQQADTTEVLGAPIGREELLNQLNAEMIPYTPEELIGIAEKEFAWCNTEMLKASREMGYGNDWKKALEKVKNTYVEPGKQPEVIVKLYNDAISFIKERDLITIPPMAEETWGMIMMSPKRQLVNPFFTGGEQISVSYPTSDMQEDDKLMSMRGNNPYFSRGTVQHELIPGHNLQYFINSRYKTYRNSFATPFNGEGWSVYWELLLYDQGFAKTPEEKIGMLFWRMHRCARIIFSLNYHLGKWTPKQCVNFLVDSVGHERANAEGEVRRSFLGDYSPLYQVGYLVGALQLMGLKHELVDSKKMTYKQFHDAIIKENLISIEMVRATLTNAPLSRDFKTNWRFYDLKKN